MNLRKRCVGQLCALLPSALFFAACGGVPFDGATDSGTGTGGADGPIGTGGQHASGGGFGTGGAHVGGGQGSGGQPNSGGQASSGGSLNTGGTWNTGGTPSVGGSPGSGGEGVGGGTSTGGALPEFFVGNITTGNGVDFGDMVYSDHWDQITPENAGKWGSVQSSPGSAFNWNTLDAIYDYAQTKGIIFKQHAFVWGNQQPSGTPSAAQVETWIQSFCERYPATRLIDVVNEPPPHTTPNYTDALGGGTNSSWQWVATSFEMAREHCGDAILMLNDFNNIEWENETDHFINIVHAIQAAGAPIDAVGAQAHDLDHAQVNFQKARGLIEKLHDETGLPVYITEFDISTTNDQTQLDRYEEYFPYFRDAGFIPGVTIWGWIRGRTWNQAPDSGLVSQQGQPRPAMTWLMNFLERPSP